MSTYPRQHAILRERPTILIAEDEPLISLVIKEHFEGQGFDCAVAMSIEAAAELVRTQSLAAALLDINLRGKQVYEVTRELVWQGVPCIFISGYDADGLPEEFAGLPFFQKPFDIEEVVAEITKCVKAHEFERLAHCSLDEHHEPQSKQD